MLQSGLSESLFGERLESFVNLRQTVSEVEDEALQFGRAFSKRPRAARVCESEVWAEGPIGNWGAAVERVTGEVFRVLLEEALSEVARNAH